MPRLGRFWIFLLICGACREGSRHWDPDDFPRVRGFSGERWPVPAESWVEVAFSRPLAPLAHGVYLVPQKSAGICNPACPGICHAGKCFVSRVDGAFLADASRGVLSSSHSAAAVELETAVEGDRLRLRPRWGSMWPSWRYDLVLTPAVQDAGGRPLLDFQGEMKAFTLTFSTPSSDDLPSEAVWLAPAPAARGVPQNLAFLVLRLSGEGATGPGIFILQDSQGEIIELSAEPFPAGCAGSLPGCAAVLLRVPSMLKSKTRYSLRCIRRVLLDGGRSLLPWMQLGEFTTGEIAWSYPPEWQTASVEMVTGCMHVAGRVFGQALAWLEDASGPRTPAQLVQDAAVELGIPGADAIRVHVLGLDGSHVLGKFLEPPGDDAGFSPGPVLVRLFPNPVGPEPAQEFVELLNAGDGFVELEGYELTDDPEKAGDLLPAYELAPGARVRIAGKGYACSIPGEPACDVDVITLNSSLAAGGLANGGEPLYLFDPAGELVSRYGGWMDTSKIPGVSVWRSSPLACDVPSGWILQ